MQASLGMGRGKGEYGRKAIGERGRKGYGMRDG